MLSPYIVNVNIFVNHMVYIEALFALVIVSLIGVALRNWLTDKRLPDLNLFIKRKFTEDNIWTDHLTTQQSPFASLTFEEATEGRGLEKKIEESALSAIKSQLEGSTGMGGVVLESIEFSRDLNRIYFDISKNGEKMIRNGRAYWEINKKTGKIIPTIKKTTDGKWVEHVEGIPNSLAKKAAKASTLIVSAAHVISGFDTVRRLDDVKSDTQFLRDARKVDQVGEIETIYDTTRESMCAAYSQRERVEVFKENYRDIHRLRTQLRREIILKLEGVQDPSEKSFFSRLFSFQKARDKSVVEETKDAISLLFWMDFCFRTQVALAMHIGWFSAFKQETLPNELKRLERVVNALEECASYLSGKYKDEGVSLDAELEGLNELVAQYERHFVQRPLSGKGPRFNTHRSKRIEG